MVKAPAVVTIQSRLFMVAYILGGFREPLAGAYSWRLYTGDFSK